MFSIWLKVSGAIMTKGYRRKLRPAAQGQMRPTRLRTHPNSDVAVGLAERRFPTAGEKP